MIEYLLNKTKVKVFASQYNPSVPFSISEDVLNIFDTILLMPDTHIGKSVPIGFVAKYDDKIIPSIVGVDIGCGVMAYDIQKQDFDAKAFHDHIEKHIPSGFNVHEYAKNCKSLNLNKLSFVLKDLNHIEKSLGTLGGGNHFIELCEGKDVYTVVVHTGSRNLGQQVCNYHEQKLNFDENSYNQYKLDIIKKLKSENRKNEINKELSLIEKNNFTQKYLSGEQLKLYINDMIIAQNFAKANRTAIMIQLLKFFDMKFDKNLAIDIPHNYIDFDNKTIHKGSIRAMKDEQVLIPLNMRDGVIFAKGKGNEMWQCSAPHGAGRELSRSEAKSLVSLEEFQEAMKDVQTFSVGQSTLDESPFAYKNSDLVINDSLNTIDIIEVRKPIFNFKAH